MASYRGAQGGFQKKMPLRMREIQQNSPENGAPQNAVYYVASPEACAAILWKSASKASEAAEALRITGPELIQASHCPFIICIFLR